MHFWWHAACFSVACSMRFGGMQHAVHPVANPCTRHFNHADRAEPNTTQCNYYSTVVRAQSTASIWAWRTRDPKGAQHNMQTAILLLTTLPDVVRLLFSNFFSPGLGLAPTTPHACCSACRPPCGT